MRKEKLIDALYDYLEIDERFILNNYIDAIDNQNILNSQHELVIASMFYLIKRKSKRPMTLDQVSMKFGVERIEIGRVYNKIKKLIGIKSCSEHSMLKTSCLVVQKPSQYLLNFISKLGLSEEKEIDIFEECKKIGKKVWSPGKYQVITFCAGLIYLCAITTGNKLSQREVADICGVTEVGLRNNFKKIIEELGFTQGDLM